MTEFEIKQLEQDARRLIVCTGCYGSGEDRWNEGRACPTCSGAGKSAAEPRVVELIERLRQKESELLDAQYSMAHISDELQRTRHIEAINSKLLAEMSATPAEKRISDLEWRLAESLAEIKRLNGEG